MGGDARRAAVAAAPPAGRTEPGLPVAGIDASRAARFRAGEALFNAAYGPATGLGPAFNENQCSACHTDPVSGGVGGVRVRRATIVDDRGRCDLLAGRGGSNIRRNVTAEARAGGLAPERVPAGAATGRFTASPLFGVGFVEAIPDSAILARADSDDRDQDGISGRVGRSADGRMARFGRKAQVATLREFVTSALHEEMGLTSSARPRDLVQGRPVSPAADPAPDPEVSDAAVDLLTEYVRLLAPVVRGAPPRPWTAADVARGERRFTTVGCASCHVPVLVTGQSSVGPLSGRALALYSDLLLHDLGPGLADVCGAGAASAELRTEPLMGLRLRELLLHDGRATSIEEAIRAHGGEASPSRTAFELLSPRERAELIVFLRTL
jgi:CxxC motif-containing protein (DUF1111 family)